MSFVSIVPEMLSAAAGNLQSIGSAVQAQNAAALAPTTGVVPAAADEVSALTAMQFAAHAQMYQTVSAQAAAIHQMFVTVLASQRRFVRRYRGRQRGRYQLRSVRNGFRSITAGSQLRADVRRTGFRAHDRRGGILGQPGHRGVLGGR